jgi:hypothetical protein
VRKNFLKDTKPSRFYEQKQITKGYKHKKPLILKINGFLHLLYGQNYWAVVSACVVSAGAAMDAVSGVAGAGVAIESTVVP